VGAGDVVVGGGALSGLGGGVCGAIGGRGASRKRHVRRIMSKNYKSSGSLGGSKKAGKENSIGRCLWGGQEQLNK